jgi:thiosulfate dehydrogenase [quinone] large subunit
MSRFRGYAVPIAILAAVVLFWMENPWFRPEQISDVARTLATVVFWVLAIVTVVLLFEDRKNPEAQTVEVEGPSFARYLFSNTRAGLVWLPIRLFLGFSWLASGWGKATGEGWLDGGSSLLGYWERAVVIPEEGRAAISFDWYRTFLQTLIDSGAEGWFAYLVVFGELAVGLGLIVGALVGVAAFFGATLNMSFLLAGSASTNPVMFALAIGLILAWRVAGYYGLDRYLLPFLGTPWRAKVKAAGGSGAGDSMRPTGMPAG